MTTDSEIRPEALVCDDDDIGAGLHRLDANTVLVVRDNCNNRRPGHNLDELGEQRERGPFATRELDGDGVEQRRHRARPRHRLENLECLCGRVPDLDRARRGLLRERLTKSVGLVVRSDDQEDGQPVIRQSRSPTRGGESYGLSRVPNLFSAPGCEAHSDRALWERSFPDHVDVGIGVELVIVCHDVQPSRQDEALRYVDACPALAHIERPRLALEAVATRDRSLNPNRNSNVESMGFSLGSPEHATL